MRVILLTILTFLLFVSNLQAYVGPGLGVGVIGAIVGLIMAILLAIVGVIWYPLKRMFKRKNKEEDSGVNESAKE